MNWYENPAARLGERTFVYIAEERGYEAEEAIATLEVIHFNWHLDDSLKRCPSFTHCTQPWLCTWRKNCVGVHSLHLASFCGCLIVVNELLEPVPGFTSTGKRRPRYDADKVDLLRDVRDRAKAIWRHPAGKARFRELDLWLAS